MNYPETPSTALPPQEAELVRLYNKTERKFTHELKLEDGSKLKCELAPHTFGKVHRVVADLWLRMFPGEVVNDNEARESITGVRAELEEAQKRIAELEKLSAATPAPAPKPRKPKIVDVV